MKITKSREKLDSIRGEIISSTSRIDFILGYFSFKENDIRDFKEV